MFCCRYAILVSVISNNVYFHTGTVYDVSAIRFIVEEVMVHSIVRLYKAVKKQFAE